MPYFVHLITLYIIFYQLDKILLFFVTFAEQYNIFKFVSQTSTVIYHLCLLTIVNVIFHLFNYLCDVFVIIDNNTCRHIKNLPKDYIFNCDYFKDKNLFIIFFVLGWKKGDDVFKREIL